MQWFNINTGDDLVKFITVMKNMEGDEDYYDYVLVMRLFQAVLENMRKNSHEGDWETLSEMLNDEQKALLNKVTDFLNTYHPDD